MVYHSLLRFPQGSLWQLFSFIQICPDVYILGSPFPEELIHVKMHQVLCHTTRFYPMQYKPEIAYSDKETVFTAYIRTLSLEIRRRIGSYLDVRPYTVVCRAGVSFWRKVHVPHQYISVEELKFYVSCETGIDMDFFVLRRWKYTLFNDFNLVDYRIEHGTQI